MPDRATLRLQLLAQVRAAAGDPPPPIAQDYDVGASGAVADLVVAAEEFIAFAIHIAGEPLPALAERLAICSRYFDRVVLVVTAKEAPAIATVDLTGAAVWMLDDAGALTEQRAGTANRVSPAALFEMMSPDQRAQLLRPALRLGFDRARPPVSPDQVRDHWRGVLGSGAMA